mgnify:CR=1 FL=1
MIKDSRRFDRMFGITVNVEIQSLIFQNKIDEYTIESQYDGFIMYEISDRDYKRNDLTNKITKALIKYGRTYKDNI